MTSGTITSPHRGLAGRFAVLAAVAGALVIFFVLAAPVHAQQEPCDPSIGSCEDISGNQVLAPDQSPAGDQAGVSNPYAVDASTLTNTAPNPVPSEGKCDNLACKLQYMVAVLLAAALKVLGYIIATLVGILIPIGKYNGFITAPAVKTGWDVIRDISNMFFVLILLIISFGTILHLEQYQMKRLLPKVLLMAILVNFSKTIAALIIDFSQVITLTFVAAYQQTGAGNFLQALGLNGLTNIIGTPGLYEDKAITTSGILGAYAVAIVYALISVVVILAYIFFFVIRIVALWLLVIFSPFAYVLSVVPTGQKYASMWWDYFSKYVILGPVLAFFLWLSLATLPHIKDTAGDFGGIKEEAPAGSAPTVLERLDKGVQDAAQYVPNAAITEAGRPLNIFSFIISIAMLMASLAFAQQIGSVVGKAAGYTYGKIATAGSATAKGALRTITPTRLGYATASGVLGGVGRLPLIGSSALNLRTNLLKYREENSKKRYGATVGAMSAEDLERASRRAVPSQLVSGLQTSDSRGKRIVGGVLSRAAGVFKTGAGKDYDTQVLAEMQKRGIARPPVSLFSRSLRSDIKERNQLSNDIEEQKVLEKKRAFGPLRQGEHERYQKLTDDLETKKLRRGELDAKIGKEKSNWQERIIRQQRKNLGYQIDYDDNEFFRHDRFGGAAANVAFERRNPTSVPTDPRRVTTGPGKGSIMNPNERTRLLERLSRTEFADVARSNLASQEEFNRLMSIPGGYLKNLADFNGDKIKPLKGEQQNRALRNLVLRAPLGFAPMVMTGKGGIRDATRLKDKLFEGNESFFGTPDGQDIINDISSKTGVDAGGIKAQMQDVIFGGGGGAGGGSAPAASSAKIDETRYQNTKALQAKYGSAYMESPEYQVNKDGYYERPNFEEFRDEELRRGHSFVPSRNQELEEHRTRGAEDAVSQATGARANNHETYAEASLDLNLADLDIEEDGRSLDREKDKVLRDSLMPKIMQQIKARGRIDESGTRRDYTDEELKDLEADLRMAKNLSLVEANQSFVQRQQTMAHERGEAVVRALPKDARGETAVDKVWSALTPEEQEEASARVRDRWGKDLEEKDVKREYYVEAGANETEWGRENGIRFTEKARRVWQDGGGQDHSLTAPEESPLPQDISHSVVAGLQQSGASLTPQSIEALTEAINTLSTNIGSHDFTNMGEDLSPAVAALVAQMRGQGQKPERLLEKIAFSMREARKTLAEMATSGESPITKENV